MEQLTLTWRQCVGDLWCKLNAVDLDHEHFNDMEGVYIIWHGGVGPKVVYVGHGVIRDHLAFHRTHQEVQAYKHEDLYVTWARVEARYRAGVDAYLSKHWAPLVRKQHPSADLIMVNSPW